MKIPSIEWNQKTWPKGLSQFKSSRSCPYFGAEWGSPEDGSFRYFIKKYVLQKKIPGNLRKVVEKYINPYIGDHQRVLEIGPGGGRWTKYLLRAKELVVVELNSEFIIYLKNRFTLFADKIRYYQTSGFEMKGIGNDRFDFVFSFGTFVHIEPEGILEYMTEIKRVLKPGAVAVIQYADKGKKPAKTKKDFSNMDANKMETFIKQQDLLIKDHNTRLLNHSNIVMFVKQK